MATTISDAKATYEAFAPTYDDFTADHAYEWWIGELLGVLERNGLSGDRLLDVGCGTGKSFQPMLARGWEITGCDISPSMLDHARAKVGDTARLTVADMRELPAFGTFDLIWALYDAINYLLSTEELELALSGIGANLASGGLLAFDLLTLHGCRTFYTAEQLIERAGRRMTWRGEGSADAAVGAICEASFEVEAQSGEVQSHMHRQRHFPEAEVRTALKVAGMVCVDVYGIYTDGILRQPLDEGAHTKAVYIVATSSEARSA